MDRKLHYQEMRVATHKRYFTEGNISNSSLVVMALLIPAVLVGWHLGKARLFGRISAQLVEAGTLVFLTYFKKQLLELFKV